MGRVDFRIIKKGKDTEKLVCIICSKTISVELLSGLLDSYPKSAGYELVLDKVVDQIIEEEDNGEH